MRRATWLACGLLGVSALAFGACGKKKHHGGSGSTNSTTSSTTGNTNGGNNTNSGTSTTGSSTTGSGGTNNTGGTGGSAGMGGQGGNGEGGAECLMLEDNSVALGEGGAPAAPDCEDIPSRAFGEEFEVSSPDFDYCGPIPDDNTCEGKLFPESVSPEVNWEEGPEGTMSYAVTFTDITILSERDPTVRGLYNQGFHWAIWDIPADVLGIPAEMSDGHHPDEIPEARQWAPFQNYAFMGPCPNMPDAEAPLNNDSYSFTVYAMPVESLDVPAGPPLDDMDAGWSPVRIMDEYLKANALAAAEYRGTSDAQASSTEGVFPPMFDLPCPAAGCDQPDNCLE